jgi:sugar phosphate isomerase/epimerase
MRGAVLLAEALGSPLVTMHYLGAPAIFSARETVDTYADLLTFLIQAAEHTGVRVAMENSPGNRNEASIFREIFQQVPEARLLLDVGHTHINTDSAGDFLDDPIVGGRLAHVHVSDNNGVDDLHLPPGSVRNSIDWQETVRMIRNHPYDGRMTLEIFSPDTGYLLLSREKLIKWWKAVGSVD